MTVVHALPDLPLVCLKTADFTKTTATAFQGKNTVIDFWTTKCTKCPAALDKLHEMALVHKDVHFVSICCDSLDGAREILESPKDEPKWNALSHFFMDHASKEQAKQYFGFKSVPFYVVVHADGNIVQHGNKVDWNDIPGVEDAKENQTATTKTKQQQQVVVEDPQQQQEPVIAERVFTMDEDF